jgi:hypothetical protein
MPSYVDADAGPAGRPPADTTACPACYEAIVRLGNAVQAIAQAIQSQTTPPSEQRIDDLRKETQSVEGQTTPSFFAYRWIS